MDQFNLLKETDFADAQSQGVLYGSFLSHLLMVSSSSESQKLVVSSSLLIMVLELSYPARWRSNRLWPFIRGPEIPQKECYVYSCPYLP